MTGNTLTELMDDLLAMGGPETEFVIFECFGDQNYIFRFMKQNQKSRFYSDNASLTIKHPAISTVRSRQK